MAPPSANQVVETELNNGLRVILQEDHSAPIVSVWTWYRVGSRNELPGKTGLSHWVEHMQFKGTASIEKGQIFRDVSRVGGTLNALTSQDWTAYFETVPSHQIDLPLRIESDRMGGSLFAPEEVESERTVILSERQGAENNPGYALYEEVVGSAFHAHPYRHMVIGYECDLRAISRDDLYAHYRRYYHPANAFIVAVGDFDSSDLLDRLERAFGAIPSGEPLPRSIGVEEPAQLGERRVLLRRPSGVPYLRLAYHAPSGADADAVPLLVAEAILSGGQPMGFAGGGLMGRSSRLYRALVASGLARAAGSDMSLNVDPYLFQIGVTGLPGSDLSELERVAVGEVKRLQHDLVPADELQRARRQLEAQFVFSSEGMTNQAYWFGHWEIVDGWHRATSLPDEIGGVTADDVRRVAQRYLLPERRTVGWLEPLASEAPAVGSPAAAALRFAPPTAWGLSGPHLATRAGQGAFRRAVLANGIPVLGQERPQSRSFALRLRVPAGAVYEDHPEESGIAFLTARSLQRGSGGRSFDEINRRLDELGGSITVDAGREFVEARVRGLREDFAELVDMLANALQRPDFPAAEVNKVKAEQLGAIAEADNDTRATADRLLRRSIYPEPNPFGRRVLGDNEIVARLDRDAVAGYHATAFSPKGATIAVVGGIGEFGHALETLSSSFNSWDGSRRAVGFENRLASNDAPVLATEADSRQEPGQHLSRRCNDSPRPPRLLRARRRKPHPRPPRTDGTPWGRGPRPAGAGLPRLEPARGSPRRHVVGGASWCRSGKYRACSSGDKVGARPAARGTRVRSGTGGREKLPDRCAAPGARDARRCRIDIAGDRGVRSRTRLPGPVPRYHRRGEPRPGTGSRKVAPGPRNAGYRHCETRGITPASGLMSPGGQRTALARCMRGFK